MDTKEALITFALKAFLERGYEAVPLRDIADAVEIKQASIYYHFKDKRELFEACVQVFFQKWYQWMGDSLPTDADLKTICKGIVHSLGMDSVIVKQLYGAQTETGQYRFLLDILTYCPHKMAQMSEFNQAFRSLITQKIEEDKRNGMIPAGVSAQSVYILLSALMEGTNIMRFTDPDIDIQNETSQLYKLLWEGISNAR